jgi:predicted DNA-binding ArsR family transcriptional regulator
MTKRVRVVNDPADLIPILESFGSSSHRKVFDILSSSWKSEEELRQLVGSNDIKESLDILQKGGLLETKWRMPEPGKTPDKEYHSSYSSVRANFQCSLADLGDVVMIMFMDSREVQKIANRISKEIESGNHSLGGLSRALGLNPTFIKGIAHRTSRFVVKGQRVELLKKTG